MEAFTSDAARCRHNIPPENCAICSPRPVFKSLHEFTDAEIAAEHHNRMMRKLGDQTKGISMPVHPDWRSGNSRD